MTLTRHYFVPCLAGTRERLVASDSLSLVEDRATGRVVVSSSVGSDEIWPAAIAVTTPEE